MKKNFTLLAFFLLYLPVAAQISTDETPVSFNIGTDQLSQRTDLKIMPKLNMAEIVEEDKMDEKDGLPPRFGFPHEVSFNLKNSGVWTSFQVVIGYGN